MNVAVTLFAASIVTTQPAVPVHPPLHPVKVLEASAAAVRVTAVPAAYGSLQSLPQSIPAGALVTRPVPFPDGMTVRT